MMHDDHRFFNEPQHCFAMDHNTYGKAHLACIPLRAAPSHRSELVNQLLLNETYQVLEAQPEWLHIRCRHDGYKGWLAANQFQSCTEAAYQAAWGSICTTTAQWDPATQQRCYLGSPLLMAAPTLLTGAPVEQACAAAQSLLNTPYLWGGRTCAGIDCSGLVQVAYRVGGWGLPRDASQQIALGEAVVWGAHQRGDLAFFDNAKGAITHVGILLDAGQILHASGWVRVDRLDKIGIWHEGQQTHRLAALRRLGVPEGWAS